MGSRGSCKSSNSQSLEFMLVVWLELFVSWVSGGKLVKFRTSCWLPCSDYGMGINCGMEMLVVLAAVPFKLRHEKGNILRIVNRLWIEGDRKSERIFAALSKPQLFSSHQLAPSHLTTAHATSFLRESYNPDTDSNTLRLSSFACSRPQLPPPPKPSAIHQLKSTNVACLALSSLVLVSQPLRFLAAPATLRSANLAAALHKRAHWEKLSTRGGLNRR